MRYHFVVNGYVDDVLRQMEEQMGFAQKYLNGMEQGEAIIYCRSAEDVRRLERHHSKEAVLISAREYAPEAVLHGLCDRITDGGLYIFGNDAAGTELSVRMAARLSGSSVPEAESLWLSEESTGDSELINKIHVMKMVYANHMEAAFVMERAPYCISLARGAASQELRMGSFVIKEEISCENMAEHIVSQEFYPEALAGGLDEAKVILAAGRGVKNKENMAVIDKTARGLKAEVAVSRPAAMNAWKPMNRLIGVSGAMVEPEVCITAGVSGAAAFYAGIEKSKFIVAINTDEKAPIMKMADVAIVDDFLPIMEELNNICK